MFSVVVFCVCLSANVILNVCERARASCVSVCLINMHGECEFGERASACVFLKCAPCVLLAGLALDYWWMGSMNDR